MRPAQFSQILPTSPLGREPRSKLLIRPRIVTPADRTVANHEHTLLHSSRYAGPTTDRLETDHDQQLDRVTIFPSETAFQGHVTRSP